MAKIRIYMVEPPGSPNCPPGLPGCVNSGLSDPQQFSAGCGDGKQFKDINDLFNWANQNGEQTRAVSSAAEAAAVCSALALPSTPQPSTPASASPTYGSQPQQVAPSTIIYGGSASNANPDAYDMTPSGGASTAAVAPNITRTVQASTASAPTTRATQGKIYRMILETKPGQIDTGATYPACNRANPEGCKPMQFASIDDAVAYANQNGETPLRVASADEAWAIVEGKSPINTANIIGGLSGGILAAGAALFAFILFRKKGKRL